MAVSTLLATQVMAILERALEAEFGLKVRVRVRPGVDLAQPILRARALFYRFRADLAPAYDGLTIRLGPDDPDNVLWFIKRSVSVESEAETERPSVATLETFDLL